MKWPFLKTAAVIATLPLSVMTEPGETFWIVSTVAFLYIFGATVLFFTHAKVRRPREGWIEWYVRICKELYTDIRNPPRRDYSYYYVLLRCGHAAQVFCNRRPEPGDLVWCPAHRRFGPAHLTEIEHSHAYPVKGVKTVTGAALAPDGTVP